MNGFFYKKKAINTPYNKFDNEHLCVYSRICYFTLLLCRLKIRKKWLTGWCFLFFSFFFFWYNNHFDEPKGERFLYLKKAKREVSKQTDHLSNKRIGQFEKTRNKVREIGRESWMCLVDPFFFRLLSWWCKGLA